MFRFTLDSSLRKFLHYENLLKDDFLGSDRNVNAAEVEEINEDKAQQVSWWWQMKCAP